MSNENDCEKNESSQKNNNRSLVRAAVFQLLYQEELNSGASGEWGEIFLNDSLAHNKKMLQFAHQLFDGVQEKKAEIDEKITAQAKNWTLNRMSATDRNVLRLAVYELLFVKTPKAVVISEALKLAEQFGSAQSFAFINGILDNFSEQNS